MSEPDIAEPQLIDLLHLGEPRVIGTWRIGDVLVDPGPSTCVELLAGALGDRPPRVLALTHVHLDHAGAAGTLVRRFPEAEVWVHERGAPHLIDPSRLIASAARLYGEEMERLWGEVLAVPSERIRVLEGGERIAGFRVAYTPGHASHHVAYLHQASGWAFTGDAAGVRIGEGPVLAPTPPPDIDLRAWLGSLDVIEAWSPRAIAMTHFGAHRDVAAHLAALRRQLERLEREGGELEEDGFAAAVRAQVSGSADAATAAAYARAMSVEQSFQGLARYLARRGERA